MGWSNYKRLRKAHLLEIFKVLGYPVGVEHYERALVYVKLPYVANVIKPSFKNE